MFKYQFRRQVFQSESCLAQSQASDWVLHQQTAGRVLAQLSGRCKPHHLPCSLLLRPEANPCFVTPQPLTLDSRMNSLKISLSKTRARPNEAPYKPLTRMGKSSGGQPFEVTVSKTALDFAVKEGMGRIRRKSPQSKPTCGSIHLDLARPPVMEHSNKLSLVMYEVRSLSTTSTRSQDFSLASDEGG
ncbi:hypothetical protein EV356DRAFT_506265 [Viridothelium virens]|uniref:Uncharacterized protein n=1 Tax=Viridothelium virens TaxID=1048519 RepID=A0A6A6H1Y6_VIRVR|nr:hypothetical protein EV356DRAFT_506265 [Viridothelium virens]